MIWPVLAFLASFPPFGSTNPMFYHTKLLKCAVSALYAIAVPQSALPLLKCRNYPFILFFKEHFIIRT